MNFFQTLLIPLLIGSSNFLFETVYAAPYQGQGPLETHPEFQLPTQGLLKRATDFWIPIYSQYTTKDGVIHDSKYMLIYDVVDFTKAQKSRGRQIKDAKDRVRKILLSLHKSGVENDPAKLDSLNVEEKLIYDLFKDVNDPNKFLAAAHYKRLRFQLGQRDAIEAGIKESGRYLPFMEEIFLKEGLPFELTRLPFVESSFNTKARSKVGASGIWQFMRSTAKSFLKIGPGVDERNDPLRATEAAAKLLRINYETLGNWSLAVTAYNHGRAGMLRASNRLGTTNLGEIIERNKARSFGFASSNFFSCLLSVYEVEHNSEKYFGKIEREAPHFFYEVTLPASIFLKDLISFMKVDREAVRDLNPGITPDGLRSRARLPKGYRLRLPNEGSGTPEDVASKARIFLAGFDKIPNKFKR